MSLLVLPLLLTVLLAVLVIVVASIAARRQGHDLLAPQGEAVVEDVRLRSRRLAEGSKRAVDSVTGKLRGRAFRRPENRSTEPSHSAPAE